MSSWLPLDLLTVCLFAVTCALVGLVGVFAQLLVKPASRPRVEVGVGIVMAVLGVSGLVLGAPWVWVPCLGVVAIGSVLVLFRLAFLAWLGRMAQTVLSRTTTVWVGLLLIGVTTLVLQLRQLEREMVGEMNLAEVVDAGISPEHALQPVESQWAVTDSGHAVPLFTIPADSGVMAAEGEAGFLSRNHLATALIRTDEADTRYNCHGFVFTGGRFWIRGSYVDQILKDNGYQSTTTPRPGDIVVYRDHITGAVAHTAVVRTVLEETGSILVESKLGSLGRFIHSSDKHPYLDTTLTFYHTGRGNHVLRGLDGVRRGTFVSAGVATE
jgi:hypothetical protein